MHLSMAELRELLNGSPQGNPQDPVTSEEPSLRIVVLHRGWVVVGMYSRDGDDVVVNYAKTVRRWGTTEGLGQLALQGPQPNTTLDITGTVRVHQLAVVQTIDCDRSKWGDTCQG